jgi:uncharacterized membrane protein
MSLDTIRQKALLIVALTVVVMGFGIAILLASEVLLSVVVILPFLAALWLVRTHHLSLTRQCLDSYLQKYQSFKR